MRQQLPVYHAENSQIAEERTLIVEQCINHGIKQMTIMHCKKLTDQILQRSHAICPQQRLQRCSDAPYPVYGQLLAGPRFEQPGENDHRSEGCRVGEECDSACRSWGCAIHEKKKK